jgi:hypothetical protein
LPASVDLYTPSPVTSASRIVHASPVPTQTTDGADGETAIAPIACTGCASKTGTYVNPLSLDFHTPPEAAPMYQVLGSPTTPDTAEIRPPATGPRNWKRRGSWAGVAVGRGRG